MAQPDAPLISTLEVGPRIEDITAATSWLADVGEAEDWPQSMRFALELSLEEALTNVVSYAFKDSSTPPRIRIACYRMPEGRVALELIDNGIPFDPTTLAEPEVPDSIEDAKIGGHGVQLMRHFLEQLAYDRDGGENRLIMVAARAAD